MPRILTAALVVALAAVLAVAVAFGVVALLDVTPKQPHDPLATFPTGPLTPTATP
ncbi:MULTISPECIES: hypothetical protein [unclassified Streptomyces]|uniref:hypothetical protein n=1 Tax=unclassified Streptomyces TaxID=2593676 RepID=UPI0033C9B2EA